MKTVVIVTLFVTLAFVRSATKERISRKKCQEYNELLKKNNICNKGHYPFVVAIGFEINDGKTEMKKTIKWSCSGALISDQYVVTVAHCASNKEYRRTKYVRLGGDFADNSTAKIFNIAATIRHPEMIFPKLYNDIVLFKLEKPIDFNELIQPACIYSGNDLPQYDVAGFSFSTSKGDRDKGILVHEINEVATKEECNKTFEESRRLPEGVNFDIQFCNKDGDISCEVNSGGVFLHKDEQLSCMQNIAGLVDIGKGICTYTPHAPEYIPGLNIKVSAYVDWIESIVWS